MGQLIATGIIQSGAKFPLFSRTVFEYLAGKPISELMPSVADIPEDSVVSFLEKVILIVHMQLTILHVIECFVHILCMYRYMCTLLHMLMHTGDRL